LKHLLIEIWYSLADLMFPPSCLACRDPITTGRAIMLCPECEAGVRPVTGPMCRCCGQPFPDAAGDDHLCGLCLTTSYHFDSARAIILYQGTATTIIHRFKYRGHTAGLSTFRSLQKQLPHLAAMAETADLIFPVPLHPAKLRQRGFNQAVLLARTFFPDQKKKIALQNLERVRRTDPQTSLSGKVRRRNLKNAFEVRNPGMVKGKNVVLVDDVFTTGTTVNECAKELKKAGALEVRVLTLARVA